MARFEAAWPVLKDHEGSKFTNYEWDPGGPTKYGITLKYAQQAGAVKGADGRPVVDIDMDDDGDVDLLDILLLDEPHAREVYLYWWNEQGYNRCWDQRVGTKIMDMSVNLGPYRAHRYAQAALNTMGCSLEVDGILGPKTMAAINSQGPEAFLMALCFQHSQHYKRWLAANPNREVARAGLLKRANWPFKFEVV